METKLSIVIPVYNRRELVGRTLASVVSQSLRPLKVILVDNNSSDGSYEELLRWQEENSAPDFEVRVLQELTPGAASARNCGLAEVDTPWVMFFDSDDVMLPGHCRRAMDACRNHPEADIIGWDTEIHLAGGGMRKGVFPESDILWNTIFHGGMATQRWMARTETVRNSGGWNSDVGLWDDVELGCRMIAAGAVTAKAVGTPAVQVFYTPGCVSDAVSGLDSEMDTALEAISCSVPLQCRPWLAFKRVSGTYENYAGRAALRSSLRRALGETDSIFYRVLLHAMYLQLRLFGRGGVAIVAPFLKRLNNR